MRAWFKSPLRRFNKARATACKFQMFQTHEARATAGVKHDGIVGLLIFSSTRSSPTRHEMLKVGNSERRQTDDIDVEVTARLPSVKTDVEVTARLPPVKTDVEVTARLPPVKTDV